MLMDVHARPDVLTHSHHIPLQFDLAARPPRPKTATHVQTWNRTKFHDPVCAEKYDSTLQEAWSDIPVNSKNSLHVILRGIHQPRTKASNAASLPDKRTKTQEWITVDTAEWLDRRNEAELAGNEQDHSLAHKMFRRLARRDKNQDRLRKIGQGSWGEISPQLRSSSFGAPAVRDLDNVFQPSGKRSQVFADYLARKLWAKNEVGEIPRILQNIIMRMEEGSENRGWDRWRFNRIISKLPSGRSCLPNEFGYEWVKRNHRSSVGRNRVFMLMEQCLQRAEVPTDLDEMIVLPSYKKKTVPENYRSLAQLMALEKVFERLIPQRIGEYVCPWLRTSFWGFRPGHGAESEIAWLRRLQERLHKSSVWGLIVSLIDFYKGFDNLRRHVVDVALRAWGFEGRLHILVMRLLIARVCVLGFRAGPNSEHFDLADGGTGAVKKNAHSKK